MPIDTADPTTAPPTESKRERVNEMEMPIEVWALRDKGDPCEETDPSRGRLVRACEDVFGPRAGDPFLAYASEEDAKEAAKYHAEWWGINCEPVRLK